VYNKGGGDRYLVRTKKIGHDISFGPTEVYPENSFYSYVFYLNGKLLAASGRINDDNNNKVFNLK
jgi:hypothetical protein